MEQVGTLAEIWRYPVKSMAGERMERCRLGPGGLAGDRGWAVRDDEIGELRSAKQLPALLLCGARYLEEPDGTDIPHVEVTLPDGSTFRTDDGDANARLSGFLDRRVSLWPLQPASDADHYRRKEPVADEADLKQLLSREGDEPLPDLSAFDPAVLEEINEFFAPRGTYFDVGPYHLLTTASIDALGRLVPEARLDVRRFRPNLLVRTPADARGFVEFDWAGSVLRIGSFTLTAGAPVPRCGMTAAQQPGLPKDPSILRTIVRETEQCLGIYAEADADGTVAVGDGVQKG